MSSDGQTVDLNIVKEECNSCGTVRTADNSFLDNFYTNYYKLNVQNYDPEYVYLSQVIPKSVMHKEWIENLLGINFNYNRSIIELGCGSGNLLNLLPFAEKFGVEPSKNAAVYASKIANVRNVGYEDIEDEEKYDVVLSTCVIEHTINPNHFLEKINKISHKETVVILGLPIQNTESFDVFFLDHLHHFTINQFIYLCNRNGFAVEKFEVGYKCITTIGYFILKKLNNISLSKIVYEENKNFYNSNTLIMNLNEFLDKQTNQKINVFGFGETSFFYQTYTNINSVVNYFIDDKKAGENDNVISIEEAKTKKILENSCLVLLANPHYHSFLKQKFRGVTNLKFYSPFSNQLEENEVAEA